MNKITALVTLLLVTSTLHAAYLVDDAETDTSTNTLEGAWVSYTDGYSTIAFTPNASPGQAGNYCRMLDWTFNIGASTLFAGAVTSLNAGWTGVDLSAYKGVRFYARGYGLYEISIGTDQTRAENNHYAKWVHISQEWTLYELPFSQFIQSWGTSQPWDPSTIFSVGFTVISAAGNTGQIWIDNIEFYLETEEHPVPDPEGKLNWNLKGKSQMLQGGCFFTVTCSDGTVFHGELMVKK
jgi:hypothetical protein